MAIDLVNNHVSFTNEFLPYDKNPSLFTNNFVNFSEIKSNYQSYFDEAITPQIYLNDVINKVNSEISEEDVSSNRSDEKFSFDGDIANYESQYSYITSYAFELPSELVGKLIGKGGRVIRKIKQYANAEIFVIGHPIKENYDLVIIEGIETEIHSAIHKIRGIYPTSIYPLITLNDVNEELLQPRSSLYFILLPEFPVDVRVSSIISSGHIFVQQINHPSYPYLPLLDECMTLCYSKNEAPSMPSPILSGTLCVAPVKDTWYRAQIIEYSEITDECLIKFLDYGGFSKIMANQLRQIRVDFISLPFLATECYLSNIVPLHNQEKFSIEACNFLESLVKTNLVVAHVTNYSINNIPYVTLYKMEANENGIDQQYTSVNQLMVEKGLVSWSDTFLF